VRELTKIKVENTQFPKEVTNQLGGETLLKCYQCGTCASSCPVARITTRYNPRLVIKNALLGNRTEVITKDSIWLCSSCYNCQERCPQGVEIAELIYALRNIAIKEGQVPLAFIEMASNLISEGRVVPISSFSLRRRDTYGLPPLKEVGVKTLTKILTSTSFTNTVNKAKEAAK
jgi:heterodisulfide reductase subunit C